MTKESMAAAAREREDAAGELVLSNGRRYRLVPLDGGAPAPRAVAPPAETREANLLTPRERQIAALVARGLDNKQIADRLSISKWTVSTHLRRVFAKLGVDRRAAMVSRCLGNPDDPR